MVILHLRNIEAMQLSKKAKQIANNIEIEAIKEDRPINAEEDLVISALAQIYTQTQRHIRGVPGSQIEQERANHNKEYRAILERQAKRN